MDAQLVCAAVNPLLAGALRLDPDAQGRAAALEGHVLAIEITGIDLTVFVEPQGPTLQCVTEPAHEPATRIAGAPASLARLASQGGTRAMFSGDLAVTGDVTVARAYKRLFDTLDPDWEEAVARVVGDSAGRQVGRFAETGAAWLRRAWAGRAADIRAWLADETEVLPARGEIEHWFDGVDRVRHDADRLAARLTRLEHARGENSDR